MKIYLGNFENFNPKVGTKI